MGDPDFPAGIGTLTWFNEIIHHLTDKLEFDSLFIKYIIKRLFLKYTRKGYPWLV